MSQSEFVVSNFYNFIAVPHYESLKEPLLQFCVELGLKGTVLLAKEGVNVSIAGTREQVDSFCSHLKELLPGLDLIPKENLADFQPFLKMKVRLKSEIVAMGVPDLDIEQYRGEYIDPKDWDDFIAQDDVIVVDTRNNYEVLLGTFDGAVNPMTNTFRAFPQWVDDNLSQYKDRKIAMCCTGGIRCEKSTAYLKQHGFKDVYHLRGGILQYLADTGNRNHKWQGDCFVFDDRFAVNENLEPAESFICSSCNVVITSDDVKFLPDRKIDKCRKCTVAS